MSTLKNSTKEALKVDDAVAEANFQEQPLQHKHLQPNETDNGASFKMCSISTKEVPKNSASVKMISQLANQWKQENLTQKKISHFLLENYKKDPSLLSSTLKENAYEIAKANMRLLVSGQ